MPTDRDAGDGDAAAPSPGRVAEGRVLTLPNGLCAARLAGSLGLVVLALAGQPFWTLVLFLCLTATDWVDGKLAIWLDQRSTFGARLDSVADAAMYAALLFAGVWLKGQVLLAEGIWIAAALLTYLVSCTAALGRFRQLPMYHTRTAKTAWFLMVAAAAALFLDGPRWILRLALTGTAVANLESLLITAVLPAWRTDVISLRTAWRMRQSKLGGR